MDSFSCNESSHGGLVATGNNEWIDEIKVVFRDDFVVVVVFLSLHIIIEKSSLRKEFTDG